MFDQHVSRSVFIFGWEGAGRIASFHLVTPTKCILTSDLKSNKNNDNEKSFAGLTSRTMSMYHKHTKREKKVGSS